MYEHININQMSLNKIKSEVPTYVFFCKIVVLEILHILL